MGNRKSKIGARSKTAAISLEDAPQPAPAETDVQKAVSGNKEVAHFISSMKAMTPHTQGDAGQKRGRLIFAMDATMSRQPTWDMALAMQGDMFEAVQEVGGLDVQLVYFRGLKECRSSKWVSNPAALAKLMATVHCAGGLTQIGKIISHARQATETLTINAMVFVGDAVEEDIDSLCHKAGDLALLGVPVFIFQEGHNRQAEIAFREIARLTKGAFCRFDQGAAAQLRALLSAVAVFAAGGRQALEDFSRSNSGRSAQLLIEQIK